VKGWTSDGTEVELVPQQEIAVREILAWDDGRGVFLKPLARGGGKSVIIATVARYAAARSHGGLLPDDPHMDVFKRDADGRQAGPAAFC
jgi:hypothetical protein